MSSAFGRFRKRKRGGANQKAAPLFRITAGESTIRCIRCGREADMSQPGGMDEIENWNIYVDGGIVTHFICDRCQTPQEHLAALEHDAGYEVVRSSDGRIFDRRREGR